MKTFTWAAAGAAALGLLASTSSAFAMDSSQTPSAGHYEWRSQPSYGPRTPTRAPIRVWVSDGKAVAASCDCGMMRGSEAQAADCMATKGRSASQG